MHDKNYLGTSVRDVISGFEGVVIGHVAYLTGCNQSLVQPRSEDPKVRPAAEWFDDSRLESLEAEAIRLPVLAEQPGCDRAAPIR
ncbi:hypothetical protein EIM50_13620 [Pseudoxanthomonas sp. SGD-10]|nr:hypothetical protein EIM50_13620 [Pseudoxanthomonas sp. SGD-10]